MQLDFKWFRLQSLTTLQLFEVIKAREAVFVVEQQCPYQEMDDMDLHSWHLLVSINEQLAAYARVVTAGVKYQQPAIGRVMTLKKFRNQQIGRALMNEAIRFTQQQFPQMDIKISAQVHLQHFYRSLGFSAVSGVYDEDGIDHIDMVKQATIIAESLQR